MFIVVYQWTIFVGNCSYGHFGLSYCKNVYLSCLQEEPGLIIPFVANHYGIGPTDCISPKGKTT